MQLFMFLLMPASQWCTSSAPTLLVFGEFQGAVDVGRHLLACEVTALLVSSVGVVRLCLQTAFTTGAKHTASNSQVSGHR